MKIELLGKQDQLLELTNIVDVMNGQVLHSLCILEQHSIIATVADKYLPTVIQLHTNVTTIAGEQIYTIDLRRSNV